MKKLLHLFLLFFTIMAFSQVDLPALEHFDFTIGRGLTTQDNWNRVGGDTNPDDITVVASPNWAIPTTTPPAANAIEVSGAGLGAGYEFNRSEGTPTIYASFLIKVTDMTTSSTQGDFFASLALLNSQGKLTRNCNVFIRQDFINSSRFNLGVSQGQNGNEIWSETQYAVDQEILIVIKKESSISSLRFASIFINPDLTGPEPTPTIVTGDRFGTPTRFVIDQNRGDLPTMVIDELRIAENWESVTTLGTESSLEVADITTYPNPVSDGTLFVNAKTNISLEIYSVLGKKVLEKSNVSSSVDVSNLAKGCYILKMKDENNAVQTKKLIIQ